MLTGIAVFALLLLGLLAIPVSLAFAIGWPREDPQDIRLGWAFGLVSVRLASSPDEPAAKEKKTKASKRPRRKKKRKRKVRNVIAAIRHDAFRRRMIRFAGDLWRSVHKENVSLRIRTGLGDPADTGQLWAVLGPVSGMLAGIEQAAVNLEPDFVDQTFEFECTGEVRVVPLQLIGLALALVASPPVWQGFQRLGIA